MYIKQTWTNGDLITANKLNHIELGIEENQLPEITTADIGKYLMGVPDTDNIQAGEVICPEQTVVFSQGEEIALTTNSMPSEPLPYGVLTVNGVQHLAKLNTDIGGFFTSEDEAPYYALLWNSNDQQFEFCANDEDWEILYGTYTLSFAVAEVGVKWGLSNYIGGTEIIGPVEPSTPIAV